MTTLKIKRATFKTSEFVFARMQGANDIAPSGDIKGGVIYHHSWGSGYQTLIFKNHEAANKWWHSETKRLSKQQNNLVQPEM